MKNLNHFGIGTTSQFLYGNIDFDTSKIGGKAEWAKDQLRSETADSLGNLLEKTSLSKDEIIQLLSKQEIQMNWSKKENIPDNSARYVFALQCALKLLGYEKIGTPALFGPITKESLRAFQAEWNADPKNKADQIKVDGFPGLETLPRLVKKLQTLTSAATINLVTPKKENEETKSGVDTMETELDSFVVDDSVMKVEIQDNTGREDTFIVEDKDADAKENKAVKVPKSLKVTFKDSGKSFYYAVSPDAKKLYWYDNKDKRYEPESTLKIEKGKLVLPEKASTDAGLDKYLKGSNLKAEVLKNTPPKEFDFRKADGTVEKITVPEYITVTYENGTKYSYTISKSGEVYFYNEKTSSYQAESYLKVEKGALMGPEKKEETMSTKLDSFVMDDNTMKVEIQDNTGREDTFIVEDKDADAKENKAVKVPKSLKVTFKDSGKSFYYAVSPDAKKLYWFNNTQKRYEPESTLKIEKGKLVAPEKKEVKLTSLDSQSIEKLIKDSQSELLKSKKIKQIATVNAPSPVEYTIEKTNSPQQKIDVSSTILITFQDDKIYEYVVSKDEQNIYWIQDKSKKVLCPSGKLTIEKGKLALHDEQVKVKNPTSLDSTKVLDLVNNSGKDLLTSGKVTKVETLSGSKSEYTVENSNPTQKVDVTATIRLTFPGNQVHEYVVLEDGKTLYWVQDKVKKILRPEGKLTIENGKLVIPETKKSKIETMGTNLKRFEVKDVIKSLENKQSKVEYELVENGKTRKINVPEYLEITFAGGKKHFYTVSEDGKTLYWYNQTDKKYHTESTLKIENGQIVLP
ncbi:peptidoglycan-binding protein [Candidatus Gracilibacteria bacterium]|nr:peptidoglycan-binding protein [Candidatus Gracilibacteria bacterium]